MIHTKRRVLWSCLLLIFIVLLGIGSWPQSDVAKTPEQRINNLSQQIRCPTCAGLSAGESDSPLAQSVREEIARRVQSGENDEQIKSYFVSRYGDTALMNPPRRGIGNAVWWIPILGGIGALIGVGAAIYVWKRRVPSTVDDEVDLSDALMIDSSSNRKMPKRQSNIIIGGVVLFVVVSGVLVIGGMSDRLPGQTSSGSIAGDSNTLLQQARELTASGKALDAVKTYDKILKIDPENVEALTYRGWLVRLAGLPDQGLESIDKAISIKPNYPDAHCFRGLIFMSDKGDAKTAVSEFELFLSNNPPQEMVQLVQQALDSAKAQLQATP